MEVSPVHSFNTDGAGTVLWPWHFLHPSRTLPYTVFERRKRRVFRFTPYMIVLCTKAYPVRYNLYWVLPMQDKRWFLVPVEETKGLDTVNVSLVLHGLVQARDDWNVFPFTT